MTVCQSHVQVQLTKLILLRSASTSCSAIEGIMDVLSSHVFSGMPTRLICVPLVDWNELFKIHKPAVAAITDLQDPVQEKKTCTKYSDLRRSLTTGLIPENPHIRICPSHKQYIRDCVPAYRGQGNKWCMQSTTSTLRQGRKDTPSPWLTKLRCYITALTYPNMPPFSSESCLYYYWHNT